MKLAKYRVTAGHYKVGHYVIYRSRKRWQLRDQLDDIVDDFYSLRDALNYAIIAQGGKRQYS